MTPSWPEQPGALAIVSSTVHDGDPCVGAAATGLPDPLCGAQAPNDDRIAPAVAASRGPSSRGAESTLAEQRSTQRIVRHAPALTDAESIGCIDWDDRNAPQPDLVAVDLKRS